MAWIYLLLAGLFEIVWAIGLKYTDGFSRFWPSVGTLAAMAVSIVLLAMAVKTLPIGTAYAVWVGIGAALTVGYSMVAGEEAISPVRVVLIVALVGCVVGLKLTH